MPRTPPPPLLRAAACAGLALWCLACAGAPARPRRSLGEALGPYGLAVAGGPGLAVVSESHRQGATMAFHSIAAEGEGLRVRVEIISPLPPSRAALYAKARRDAIRSLYEDPAALYPGERAITARCPPDRKPREVEVSVLGAPQPALLAGAGANLAFGACAAGELRYAGLYLPFHDPETGALLQFSVFAPAREGLPDPDAPARTFMESLTRRPKEP